MAISKQETNKDEVPYTVHTTPEASAPVKFVGMLIATCFSLVYLVTPFYMVYCLYKLVTLSPNLICVPLVLSVIIPTHHSPWAVSNLLGPMLPYFDYTEIRETSDEDMLKHFSSGKSFILAAVPHGVISFTGMCSAVYCIPEFRKIKTAAASVILSVPILKHVLGIFGLTDAAGKNLSRYISKGGASGSVVIYIGGIAELFKSSRKAERLYLSKRKGFIKLALRSGADILPLYLIGNTACLTVVKSGPLASMSRKLQMSITLFWGRWNLPIPRNDKLVYVRGRPLGLPKIDDPTQEDIDKWHAKYMEEVARMFETYKGLSPAYANKEFHID